MPEQQLPIILASGSKTRQTMLSNAGVEYTIQPADIDEHELKNQAVAQNINPAQIALKLAAAKARAVSNEHPETLVIGSDQILELDGRLLSKVSSMAEASSTLSTLEGKPHYLHSAVACYVSGTPVYEFVDTATLTMWPLTKTDIANYLQDAGEVILGSVGCYQIEGKGIRLFRDIEGSHFTIMGMPLIPLLGFLRDCRSQRKR